MESFHYSSINKKKDISQNNILLNEYEEIISSSQLAIMLKEEEITNLKINLKENILIIVYFFFRFLFKSYDFTIR